MTTKLNIGSLVKINPDIFKSMTKLDDMGGSVGESPLIKDFIFRVEGYDHTEYVGDFYVCAIHRHPTIITLPTDERKYRVSKAVGNIRLPVKDCIRVSDKLTLKYSIVDTKSIKANELSNLKAKVKELFAFRNEKKKAGMKISQPVLVKNWQQITDTRKMIEKLEKSTSGDSVFIDSIGKTFQLPPSTKSKEKIDEFVLSMISSYRSVLKVEKSTTNKVGAKLVGGVYSKERTVVEIHEDRIKNLINAYKSPTTNDNYVGIEVECFHKNNREELKKECVKKRLHNVVNIGDDGSIRADYGTASEIRFLSKESDLKDNLIKLGEVLYSDEVSAGANSSCGLHVHIDIRNRDRDVVYNNFFHVQELMFAAQPLVRRDNTFCKKSPKQMQENDRYQAINVSTSKGITGKDSNTIEIRLHQGTVDVRDIYRWVLFLVGVANLPKLSKSYTTIEALRADFGDKINEKAFEYMSNKIAEYNKSFKDLAL